MSGVVVFDPAKFVLRYPEFTSVPPERLQLFFDDATTIVNNSPRSRITDLGVRERILFALTAHIAALEGANVDGSVTVFNSSSAGGTGRLQSATEGSVSISFDNVPLKTSKQGWFQTTKYGQRAWVLMRPWMSFRYVPGGADVRF